MSYLSIEFFIVFVLFLLLYWTFAFSPRFQNLLLILASYAVLWSFSADFAAILLGYTVLVQTLAIFLNRYPRFQKTNAFLITLLVCALLFVFKYHNFFLESFNEVLLALGSGFSFSTLQWLLPIGISFYAFHSVSYLVAVKRQEMRPIAFLDLLLYLAFFPSLIAGPINRVADFLPQIRVAALRTVIDLPRAMLLLALAITKLLLFSSWFAESFVNPVFSSPSIQSPEAILVGVYAYSFQIYFNFSGYTDLVTGMAMLLGFRLPQNFNFPYLAENLSEFWKRWHMSLSSFIRDYVYIPLGGKRCGFWRAQVNMSVAMLLSGLWHGAGAHFIVWGALHALGLMAMKLGRRLFPRAGTLLTRLGLARLLTFHYVCLTWVFFRSETLGDAYSLLLGLLDLSLPSLLSSGSALGFIALVLFYPLVIKTARSFAHAALMVPAVVYPVLLSAFVYGVVLLSPPGIPEFIYARF